jgi:PAS domain-containing protein
MTATDVRQRRWAAHPWQARGLRLLVYLLPILGSLGVVHLATSLTGVPTSSLTVFLAWWFAISLLATGVVSVIYAASRRLMPLGALLELSLVFPDEAPSRFQLALRTGTVDDLQERLQRMREANEELSAQEAAEILLQLVAALDDHDKITRGHAERVRAYSYSLGKQLHLADDDLDRLNWAALLHDIGKLEVSTEILNKNGKPTDEEWEQLRLHPIYGEALVELLREWLGQWTEAVGYHHERWDGKGYPRGIAGGQIPLAGRIVAIADVFDVITSARSYKEPATATEAREEIARCAGSQFDPRLVRAFVNISLGRMRLVMGPLSWLSHAPLLARLPITPSVGAAFGAVATLATATTAGMLPANDLARAASAPLASPAAVSRLTPPAPPAKSRRRPAPKPRVQERERVASPVAAADPAVLPTTNPPPPVVDVPPPAASPEPEPTSPESTPAPPPPPPTSPSPDPPPAPAPPATPPSAPGPPAPPPPAPAPPPAPPPPAPPPPPPPPLPPPPPPVNQAPSFSAGASQTVVEDSGARSVSSWATAISPGPASESSQAVTFTVSNDNSSLFGVEPAVAPDGTLTYTPAADANGVATVTVIAHDDGGTANGGIDNSPPQTFTVTVDPVNDAPSFSAGPDQTVVSLLGGQAIPGWATNIVSGPADESPQNVSFIVTNDNPGLFSAQPAVSPSGTLTFTPTLLAIGSATVTVRAADNGGTANGGQDKSPPQTFTITII